MAFTRNLLRSVLLAGALVASAGAHAVDLRVAIADDPDALDPVTNRAQTGITVLNVMCERLMSTDTKLTILPGLATAWTWSADAKVLTLKLVEGAKFQDGTPFDAEAARFNVDRALNQPGSQRADNISSITKIEAVSPTELRITVKEPSVQLLAMLAERVGIMYSPTAVKSLGDKIGTKPICVGPYKFVERVAQDRIVLEKDPNYRLASKYHFDRVIFRVIPDDTVRLANLQSRDVDIIEKLDPSAAQVVEKDNRLQLMPVSTPNNQTLVINLTKPGPMQDPRVREAFELTLDRKAIVDVAFAGKYLPANQFAEPGSPFYNEKFPIPARDTKRAKELLAQAGVPSPTPFTILVPNRPLAVRVAEMIQAMSNEGGFATKLQVVEFATTLKMTDAGDFESWGPIGPQFANEPDTLAYQVLFSTAGRNVSRYKSAEMDAALNASRAETDPAKRIAIFKTIAEIAVKDRPVIYLYHQRPLYAATARLKGVFTTGDGFIQLEGAKFE
ncbi:ABC transporter substrate-binding protein [uncultured Alsobacter sp.]|uniref:ABC transporter substrate-binding protein n=1 Tax=uncultured Alsobacter sp. TaxID=1748258 RepID=UPI0025E881FF|nr:ABC transporter substrate-binding protein [uncultured Alsobacter sp.]